MRTVLYNSLYLDGVDKVGTPRFWRNLDWVKYYSDLNHVEHIILNDNGSNQGLISKFLQEYRYLRSRAIIEVIPNEGLEHGRHSTYDYRHLWRVVYHLKELLKDFDKVLMIDTDTYILSPNCLKFLKDVETGWHVFWSNKYQFPAAEVQVVCKDMLPVIEEFTSKPIESYYGKCMETTLPYTEIHKEFIGDRYGETFLMQHPKMDWYSQTPWQIRMIWDMQGKLTKP